jgi:hypothetical protein
MLGGCSLHANPESQKWDPIRFADQIGVVEKSAFSRISRGKRTHKSMFGMDV